MHAPSFARASLTQIMRVTEANLLGNIHGGEIVKLADTTAGIVAFRHCGAPAVTAALDEMVFLAPVKVGDMVQTFGEVNWAGRTSVEVGVRIEAQQYSDPAAPTVHVASAYFVMVAINADGRPLTVPGLSPETPDEVRRFREAEIRRATRLARKAEIDAGRL
jgi:acyl-CoA hydrolase